MSGDFDTIENNSWQVSLNTPGFIWLTADHECGGVIIGKQWILTIDIKEIHHYNAHESNDYIMDFAIIELKKELKFSEKIKKIKLADESFDFTGNYTAVISGYGRTGAKEDPSQYLKRAELSIITTDKCNLERQNTNRICARQLHQKVTSTKINTIILFNSEL